MAAIELNEELRELLAEDHDLVELRTRFNTLFSQFPVSTVEMIREKLNASRIDGRVYYQEGSMLSPECGCIKGWLAYSIEPETVKSFGVIGVPYPITLIFEKHGIQSIVGLGTPEERFVGAIARGTPENNVNASWLLETINLHIEARKEENQ